MKLPNEVADKSAANLPVILPPSLPRNSHLRNRHNCTVSSQLSVWMKEGDKYMAKMIGMYQWQDCHVKINKINTTGSCLVSRWIGSRRQTSEYDFEISQWTRFPYEGPRATQVEAQAPLSSLKTPYQALFPSAGTFAFAVSFSLFQVFAKSALLLFLFAYVYAYVYV